MKKLFRKLFGFPIWTEDLDGELRKRRAKYLPDGRIVTKGIYGYIAGNTDGSFDPGYIRRWFKRGDEHVNSED